MLTRYIFFDVGYTLVNEDEVWRIRCEEQAETAEAKALGLDAEAIYREIVLATQSYLPQYRTVVKKYGFNEVAPYRHDAETLYPDVKSTLSLLSKRYSLGIIANQADGLAKRLREWGIDKFFSIVISSWDCGVMKPDVRIFEAALLKTGCMPEEAVMVGDRLDNDVFPANRLGLKTVWIKNGFGGMQEPISEEYEPNFMIGSLNELINLDFRSVEK